MLRSITVEVNTAQILQNNIKELLPKERLELVLKLMPYTLPKVNSISHTTNEPLDWGLD